MKLKSFIDDYYSVSPYGKDSYDNLRLSLDTGKGLAFNTSAYVRLGTNAYGGSGHDTNSTAIYNMSDPNYRLGVNKNPKDGDQAVFAEFGNTTLVIPGWDFYLIDTYEDVYVAYVRKAKPPGLYLAPDPNETTTYIGTDGLTYTVPRLMVKKFDRGMVDIYNYWWRVQRWSGTGATN